MFRKIHELFEIGYFKYNRNDVNSDTANKRLIEFSGEKSGEFSKLYFEQMKDKVDDVEFLSDRIDKDLLNPFKNNPYTQSLSSFAY